MTFAGPKKVNKDNMVDYNYIANKKNNEDDSINQSSRKND